MCYIAIFSSTVILLLLFSCNRVFVMAQNDTIFNLTVLHFNDFHARFDPVNARTAQECKKDIEDPCIGGFAKLYTLSRKLKRENPSAIFLNAGDVFTGSLWYKLFKWNVTAHFMNMLPVDAMTVGNHEFDDRMHILVNYLKHVNLPALMVNVDATKEPSIKPYIIKSTIIKVDDRKIGIIGFVTKTYAEIASIGKLKMLDEVETVNAEAKVLHSKGVDIIIGLSHAGFSEDLRIAKSIDADIIVGGHSHTFLFTGTPPSFDTAESEYPTVVTQDNGRKVLIVQAGAFSKYLGYLTVSFDKSNNILSWEGNPIILDENVGQDSHILDELEPWRTEVHKIGERVVGETQVFLSPSLCRLGECNIGKLITDAMVYEYSKQKQGNCWTRAAISFINSGGIRSSILRGTITYASLLNALPFGETYDLVQITGKYLKEALEYSVAGKSNAEFLQVSGIKAVIDLEKPKNHRVSRIYVRCSDCAVPQYEPLKFSKPYNIVLTSFVYEGGDGYTMIKKNAKLHEKGRVDTDILQDYLASNSPVFIEPEGNIIVHASKKTVDDIRAASDSEIVPND